MRWRLDSKAIRSNNRITSHRLHVSLTSVVTGLPAAAAAISMHMYFVFFPLTGLLSIFVTFSVPLLCLCVLIGTLHLNDIRSSRDLLVFW